MFRFLAIILTFPISALAQDYMPVELYDDADIEFSVESVNEITVPVIGPGGPTSVTVSVGSDGIGVFQGDIVLGKASSLLSDGDALPFGSGTSNPAALWPNRTLRYLAVTDPRLASVVSRAVAAWERTGVIRFEKISSPNGDYVEFVHTDVCRSPLGRQGGRQMIEIGEGCPLGHVVHELGHALGLMHEQVRNDRNSYIEYFPMNVKSGHGHNFATNASLYVDIGPYCYESIMHYGERTFAKPGKKTLQIRSSGFSLPHEGNRIGQRSRISPCDIRSLDRLYQ